MNYNRSQLQNQRQTSESQKQCHETVSYAKVVDINKEIQESVDFEKRMVIIDGSNVAFL